MNWLMTGCDPSDLKTAALNKLGLCHYVGSFCSKGMFGSCTQQEKTFCCFNSKLARIIHEQARPQLKSFGVNGSWGEPKNPNCRGFTPQEFQMIDFSKVDLTEFYKDIQKKINKAPQTFQTDVNENAAQWKQRFEKNSSAAPSLP